MAKKAVLVGVNRYRIPGADLRGCVPDVKNMSRLLQTRFGFDPADITMLTDFDATKNAMEQAITGLVSGAKKGDVLLLHYSGHGSNVPDDNGDEADGRDEILCPTDLDWYHPFRDDWLRGVFDGVASGVSLTMISDSCHSGTVTRSFEPPDVEIKQRYLPCPLDLIAAESNRDLTGTIRSTLRTRSTGVRRARDVVAVDIPEVLIAGCRDDQTSADAHINGGFAGALTYNLVDVLEQAGGRLSYRELHDETSLKLKGHYEQIPQLEGNEERLEQPFLSPIE